MAVNPWIGFSSIPATSVSLTVSTTISQCMRLCCGDHSALQNEDRSRCFGKLVLPLLDYKLSNSRKQDGKTLKCAAQDASHIVPEVEA